MNAALPPVERRRVRACYCVVTFAPGFVAAITWSCVAIDRWKLLPLGFGVTEVIFQVNWAVAAFASAAGAFLLPGRTMTRLVVDSLAAGFVGLLAYFGWMAAISIAYWALFL